MDARDLFLAQHAAVQSAAVGNNPASAAERTFGGLTEDQMKVRPREDLNSIAWLMWHIARAEDIMLNPVLNDTSQVLDDAWLKRLNISRRDFGIGMKTEEVTALTKAIDVGALREYRDAVGKRTRELVGAYKEADWGGTIEAAALEKAASQGAFGPTVVKVFTGRPRTAVLSGIALFHPSGHMGEAVTVRSAGGFGIGV
jgi:DinB superfamily